LLDSKKAPGNKRKLDENGRKLLEEDPRARPTATYEQRIEFLNTLLGVKVSKFTTCRVASSRRPSSSRRRSRPSYAAAPRPEAARHS